MDSWGKMGHFKCCISKERFLVLVVKGKTSEKLH